MNSVPFPSCYWVIPGQFLAGEYPGNFPMDPRAQLKLRVLLQAGITRWIDLTQPGELASYQPLLLKEAQQMGIEVQHTRFPIPDMGVPDPAGMVAILDAIDAALAARQPLYLHCWGGIGRTGTVVGCYLVRHGLSGEAALAEIAHLRQAVPDAWRLSPETSLQHEMVRNWQMNG